jgi:hypothetical protein
MSHDEAVECFAAEQYLLDEMTLELCDEFEQHFFDCRECAIDLLAGATFLTLMGSRRWDTSIMLQDRANPLSDN